MKHKLTQITSLMLIVTFAWQSECHAGCLRPVAAGERIKGEYADSATLEAYLADIREAEARGEISYHEEARGIVDSFSHFVRLDGSNTRPNTDYGKRSFDELFNAMFRMHSAARAVPVLETGPGAGLVLSEMSRAAEKSGEKIEIDTISLTPVAPRFRLLANAYQIESWADEWLSRNPDDAEIEEIKRKYARRVSLELAFALQRRGYPVFDILKRPFIRRQYIGRLLFLEIEPNKKYMFIYDDRGGIYHSYSKIDDDVINNILNMLDREGILWVRNIFDKGDIKLLSANKRGKDFVFVGCGWSGAEYIIVHKDSLISRQLSHDRRAISQLGGLLYVVPDIETLTDVMSGIDIPSGEVAPAPEPQQIAANAIAFGAMVLQEHI